MEPTALLNAARSICVYENGRERARQREIGVEASKVADIVRQVGQDRGYDVIQVFVDHTRNVRVWVDHPQGVSADSTRQLSKDICFALDEAGTDPGNYRFEVQSPGVDRLLARPQDFERFADNDVTVKLRKGEDGPLKLKGRLKGWIDERVVVDIDGTEQRFELTAIREVRLIPDLPFLSAGEQKARRASRKRGRQKNAHKKPGQPKRGGHRKRKRKDGR